MRADRQSNRDNRGVELAAAPLEARWCSRSSDRDSRAGGGKVADRRLGRRPVPSLSFAGGDSAVALPARGRVHRMVPEPRGRFSLLGHRGTEIRRGVEARLLLRQLGLWSIELDRRRARVRLIATRRWVGHLPLAGFRRDAPGVAVGAEPSRPAHLRPELGVPRRAAAGLRWSSSQARRVPLAASIYRTSSPLFLPRTSARLNGRGRRRRVVRLRRN
jgi:hypothetical protein